MFLAGKFEQRDSAAAALSDLQANGFTPVDLDVFSDEPVEFAPGVLDRPSRMSLAAVSGAAAFFLLVAGFVYFTQYNYPLITGGMPTFSFWATGVVFFEITMFGAILTTFGFFLRESGLLRRGPRAPVPVIEPGVICLRVNCRPEQRDDVGRCLKQAGAIDVMELGDRP